ncbi:MAG: PIN domain-containing protein [Ktedonobacteraceae bacterium]
MSISYLLDSSVLILSLNKDQIIRSKLADVNALYASTIALGELYYGAERSIQVARNIAEINELAKDLTILNIDARTARYYAHIKHDQENRGLKLPENDLWIAATAMQFGLTLAAHDHHFTWVPGLALEQW